MINKTEEKVKVYLYDFRGKYTLFLLFLSNDLNWLNFSLPALIFVFIFYFESTSGRLQ